MTKTPPLSESALLDPIRTVRWVWLSRLVVSCAILVAAVVVWNRAEPRDTLVATLAFTIAMIATVASVLHQAIEKRPTGTRFYALQCATDLGLVTAIVDITGGWGSQFAALYVLTIASAALLLPLRGTMLVAVGACLLYAADGLWFRPGGVMVGMLVQTGVFLTVALGAGVLAQRLRQQGVGQEALAAQLAKVQLEAADILRSIRAGIVTVDASGRLLYANPAASELLGIDLSRLLGTPVFGPLRIASRQLADVLEQSVRDGQRATRVEGVITRGEDFIDIGVTTTVAALPDDTTGHSATAIFQDISDSKRLQALHVRTERLEAVADLSASLAHEIRNPLASIRSATEQLARRREQSAVPADDDEQILHGLVLREADRLSRLLGDSLDLARARVTKISTLDLGALVGNAARVVAAHPDCHPEAVVSVEVAPDMPLIAGDQDLLYRAVFNLALNAVQALSGPGHVRIQLQRETSAETATTRPFGDLEIPWVALRVIDDGPGIPIALRNRLFEPFVSGRSGGTGLGLPVVHRAVEAHGGVVLVDALPQGTCFTVLLPVESPAVAVDRTRRGRAFPQVAIADVADLDVADHDLADLDATNATA